MTIMSKKFKIYLAVFTVILVLLLAFFLIRPSFKKTNPQTGGVPDSSAPVAFKSLKGVIADIFSGGHDEEFVFL